VVGYCPNPDTGRAERDSEGEWVLPRTPEERAMILGVSRPAAPAEPIDDDEAAKWL
jgi:hypothetical protein